MINYAALADRAFDELSRLVGDGALPYDRERASELAATFWDAVEARDRVGEHSVWSKRPPREELLPFAATPIAEVVAHFAAPLSTLYGWFRHYGIKREQPVGRKRRT